LAFGFIAQLLATEGQDDKRVHPSSQKMTNQKKANQIPLSSSDSSNRTAGASVEQIPPIPGMKEAGDTVTRLFELFPFGQFFNLGYLFPLL
jgi:hypothetical protein